MNLKLLLLLFIAMDHAVADMDVFEIRHKNQLTCVDINTLPVAEQCAFIKNNCSLPDESWGTIGYVRLYYCAFSRAWALALIFTSLLLSFVGLAHAASEYLCPNLYSISQLLAFSDNLSGLTLLAFGNSSADIFSTYHALESGSISLATSELISAALIILTVVVGLISITKPFKVPKFFFFRDAFFYLLISSIVLIVLIYGAINFISAAALIASYVFYVAFAVFTHSYLSKFARALANIARVRSNYSRNPDSEAVNATESPDFPSIDLLSQEIDEEDELIDDEYAEFLASHPHPNLEDRIPIGAGSYALTLLLKQLREHSSRFITKNSRGIALSPHDSPAITPVSNETPIPDGLSSSDHLIDEREIDPHPLWKRLFPKLYSGQSPLYQMYLVLTTPVSILFKLTIPNRTMSIRHCEKLSSCCALTSTFTNNSLENCNDDGFDFDLDMTFYKIQIVLSALMVTYFLKETSYWWNAGFALIAVSIGATFLVPKRSPELEVNLNQYHIWNSFGSFVGFCTSLMWISIFASEIIAALKAAGTVFGVADDKVGATFFALGNSVGDLVSNLSIARMGMPVMAFSACFGGPILSICSLGLSSAIIMAHTNTSSIQIKFSNVLKVTLLALIATLVFLVAFIPRNNWMFDKKVGWILIVWWLALMALVLIV